MCHRSNADRRRALCLTGKHHSPPMPPRRPRPPIIRLAPLLILAIGVAASGCGAKRPVIYEGGPGARQAIAECEQRARQGGADSGRLGTVARDTATGAAMGAAATGIYGAVRGDSDVGNRAAAGAAAGAGVALIRSGVRASEPSAAYRGYVNRCLRDRGYDVVGWN